MYTLLLTKKKETVKLCRAALAALPSEASWSAIKSRWLDQYELLKNGQAPNVGQKIAFKNLQMTPDFTPNLVQFVGQVVSFDGNNVTFKVLYDETEGQERLTKFDLDEKQDLEKKSNEVTVNWLMLQEKRLIE